MGYHVESGLYVVTGYALALVGYPKDILGIYEYGSAHYIVSQGIHMGESTCGYVKMIYAAVILDQKNLVGITGYCQHLCEMELTL